MPGPIENTVKDVKLAGTFAKSAGPSIVLGVVVIALVVLLIFQAASFKDRWTASDQRVFVSDVILPIIKTQKDIAALLIEHERLPAHREAVQWREEAVRRNQQIIERLERIENKINKLK